MVKDFKPVWLIQGNDPCIFAGVFDEIAGKLSKQYLEKNFDLTEKDREKAQRRIREMAQDMYIIVREFESNMKK